ncbi:MAG: hydrogenase nickel incorporation protein HypB [Clostridia bacterium]|jgi:hydrogenase nickel incorporation protein HypB|nr:hydrogenase nickel incorporation protein HypB [Clostridia bacterium]MCI9459968.1 hydrogenase nickel incorporation protein HypB [Clostridia bacterium]
MEKVRTIKLERSVLADNDADADALRKELKQKRVFLVNVMSSPGSGKTTLLISLVNRLAKRFRVGVMEADIDSDVDAVKVAEKADCKAVQLHTGGMCHLDAAMTRQGLKELGTDGLDVVFLENVGNLVCPAEFDTGACLDMTILSVSEGDDKPLKYPLIYQKCALVLISKLDALPYFPFDIEKCKQNIRRRNPHSTILPVSAKTGDGMDDAAEWFAKAINNFRESK